MKNFKKDFFLPIIIVSFILLVLFRLGIKPILLRDSISENISTKVNLVTWFIQIFLATILWVAAFLLAGEQLRISNKQTLLSEEQKEISNRQIKLSNKQMDLAGVQLEMTKIMFEVERIEGKRMGALAETEKYNAE